MSHSAPAIVLAEGGHTPVPVHKDKSLCKGSVTEGTCHRKKEKVLSIERTSNWETVLRGGWGCKGWAWLTRHGHDSSSYM
jgi:hypothetical protein